MIYELIASRDPITFHAESDAVAFYAGLILGSGRASVRREDDESIPCMFLLESSEQVDSTIQIVLGTDLDTFARANAKAIGAAFSSFAYGRIESRRTFDAAVAAIADPDDLAAFKASHEDCNRSSLSAWVRLAWGMGNSYAKMA